MIKTFQSLNCAWNNFFTGKYLEFRGKTERLENGTSYGSYICDCFFDGLVAIKEGGAICWNTWSPKNRVLVESTSIINCKAEIGGGFWVGQEGYATLYKVCGFNCLATDHASFMYSYLNVSDSILSLNMSSIVSCKSITKNTIFSQEGVFFINSVNESTNYAEHRSGFFSINHDSEIRTYVVDVEFTMFYNNTATNENLFRFMDYDKKFLFSNCNIISNKESTFYENFLIVSFGDLVLKNNCIIDNTATTVLSSRTGTIDNCVIDFAPPDNFSVLNTPEKSFFNKMDLLTTKNCPAFTLVFEGMDPIERTTEPISLLPIYKTYRRYTWNRKITLIFTIVFIAF